MKFIATITETLEKQVPIEAENEQEAHRKIYEMYRNCEIVLDASDYVDTNFDYKIATEKEWDYINQKL